MKERNMRVGAMILAVAAAGTMVSAAAGPDLSNDPTVVAVQPSYTDLDFAALDAPVPVVREPIAR